LDTKRAQMVRLDVKYPLSARYQIIHSEMSQGYRKLAFFQITVENMDYHHLSQFATIPDYW
jgi:hypothetical protein